MVKEKIWISWIKKEYFNGIRWKGKESESDFSGEIFYEGYWLNGSGKTYKYTTLEMYDRIEITIHYNYYFRKLKKKRRLEIYII